jgi:hypothetical protein
VAPGVTVRAEITHHLLHGTVGEVCIGPFRRGSLAVANHFFASAANSSTVMPLCFSTYSRRSFIFMKSPAEQQCAGVLSACGRNCVTHSLEISSSLGN